MADNRCNQTKAEYSDEVLTDVLLFTHLVHLPLAYASKPILRIYASRRFKGIAKGYFEEWFGEHWMVRRALNVRRA